MVASVKLAIFPRLGKLFPCLGKFALRFLIYEDLSRFHAITGMMAAVVDRMMNSAVSMV